MKKMKTRNLLPIGSVVLLQGGKKKVMIIGIKQLNMENQEEYDYLAVLYPEGFIADMSMFFFNHDAIEDVYHMGYRNQEHDIFRDQLDELYEKKEQQ